MAETKAEAHVDEDVEKTSLPAHVALCNERWERVYGEMHEMGELLKALRQDFKGLTYGVLGLLLTITGTLIYRFIFIPHVH